MRDAVIVAAVRTPVGKRGGGLSGVHPVDLGGHVLRSLLDDPSPVEDVIFGCVSQAGEQSWNVGRNVVLAAGWPERIPGTTLDRQCGSSQQAVHFAAATVVSGQADFVVAGGVEVMSRVPMGSSAGDAMPYGEAVRARYRDAEGFADGAQIPFNQGVGAEMMAARWGLSRRQLDEYSLASTPRRTRPTSATRSRRSRASRATRASAGIHRWSSWRRSRHPSSPMAW